MDSFAAAERAPSRSSGVQISYPESRKHFTRNNNKAPDPLVTTKTPLKRGNSVSSSNLNSTATSQKNLKTKESTQSSILKAPRKRRNEVEVLVGPSSHNEVVNPKGKKRASLLETKNVSESVDRQQNNTGTEANLIALLMDQVRKLQESNAQRDIKLADALNKKNDDDARERLNYKTATEKDYQAKLEDQKKKYIESYENLSREHHNVLKERLETSTAQALREKEDEAKRQKAQRDFEETQSKRDEDRKEKAQRDFFEAQANFQKLYQETSEKLKKDYDDMLQKRVNEVQLEKRLELEELERKSKNEKQEEARRYQLLLDAEAQKIQELMVSRLQTLEEEVKGKKNVDLEKQRNDAMRERLLIEQGQQRLTELADLAIQERKNRLLAEDFQRKKEEYEQSQKQKNDKEKEERDQNLSYAEKELIINERKAALEEARKSGDERRKAAEHQRTQESRRY
jgi:hypothetical protein